MEFQALVEARRSVRAFDASKEVSLADLEEMIRCAQQAPTWKNSQTGRYYVISSAEKLAEIKTNCLPEFNQKSCADAPALIVTCFEKNRAGFDREGNADNELGNEWGAYDLGLTNMLLCLKAKELGYDTLIMGIRDGDALRKELTIPDSQEVVAVIAVGKRATDPSTPPRKDLDHVAKFF